METPLYHAGNRELQDRFDSRRIADRLEQVTLHDQFTDGDRALVERCAMFFLATADAQGQPDVSYKGGLPGFVRVVDAQTLAFPDYDGNGMFKSLGNILVNPKVGLLFVDFEQPHRCGSTVYSPRPEHVPPAPDWKQNDAFRDALPGAGRTESR